MGIGGQQMLRQGLEAWFPMEKLAVRGYAEVLRRLPELLSIRKRLLQRLLAKPPRLFIGIDAPDFNLGVETKLQQHGIRTVHYVSPSIWAWRGERIREIKKAVSHMIALFPMEPPIYEAANIPVSYVGHPFADQIAFDNPRVPAAEAMGILPDKPVFALLPGSREAEVSYMAETFIHTAKLINQQLPTAQFLAPLSTRETNHIFNAALRRHLGFHAGEFPLRVVFGHPRETITAASFVLAASGTVTLESMLIKRPMVITYKMAPASYRIMRNKGYLPYVGLPNILAEDFIAPEILQDDATPENLSQALLNLYRDPSVAARQCEVFGTLHHQLRQGAADKAAAVVRSFLVPGDDSTQ